LTKLLIDHDLLIYKGLFATQQVIKNGEEVIGVRGYFAGLRATDNIVYNILDTFSGSDFELVMTGEGNFRKKLYPEYKSHRKADGRPKYLYEAKSYYKKYWNAVSTTGEEADDYIASNITDNCVVISEDHDYKQLGVPIFNPRTWQITEINNPEFWFWLQCLTGCKSDHVPGLKNPDKLHFKSPPCFTEDTASQLLEGKSPREMKQIVQEKYQVIYGDEWYSRFDLTARLLFLRRKDHKEYYSWINY
jgi:5'-3' exonuclease